MIHVVELLDDADIRGALEAELIRCGGRLRWVGDGTDRVSWGDLVAMLRFAEPESVLGRAVSGRLHDWSFTQHLLAGVFDATWAMVWQNGGGKGAKPEGLPRPDERRVRRVDASELPAPVGDPFKADESGVFRGESVPIDELNEWLGWA